MFSQSRTCRTFCWPKQTTRDSVSSESFRTARSIYRLELEGLNVEKLLGRPSFRCAITEIPFPEYSWREFGRSNTQRTRLTAVTLRPIARTNRSGARRSTRSMEFVPTSRMRSSTISRCTKPISMVTEQLATRSSRRRAGLATRRESVLIVASKMLSFAPSPSSTRPLNRPNPKKAPLLRVRTLPPALLTRRQSQLPRQVYERHVRSVLKPSLPHLPPPLRHLLVRHAKKGGLSLRTPKIRSERTNVLEDHPGPA